MWDSGHSVQPFQWYNFATSFVISASHYFLVVKMSQIKASHKKILEDLLKKDCNKVCADCRAKGNCVFDWASDVRRSSLGFGYSRLLHLHPLFGCPP